MKVIGLIGMPGAGKGECAKLGKEAGCTIVNMGDLIRDCTQKKGYKLEDANIGMVAHLEREKFGYNIWAKRTVEKIQKLSLSNNSIVIIDGIRGLDEVSTFKEAFGDTMITIAIKMPVEMRFELLKKRKRSDAPQTLVEFRKRDKRETRWGIVEAIDDADFIILNTGPLLELKESFNELLSHIKQS